MSKNGIEKFDESLKDKIYSIRGFQVMLDRDLAELYGVETKVLNQAVKRNKERFPENFCFQILLDEYEILLFSSGSKANKNLISRSQTVTSILANRNLVTMKKGGRTYLPYAFTEQGVAMLAGVLKSQTAVRISISIVNAFVAMRNFIQSNVQIFQRLDNVEVRLLEHDQKFDKLFDAMHSDEIISTQGIFFENQIFDAYKFVSDLFRSAKKSILIIDNYIDDSVLAKSGSHSQRSRSRIWNY